MLWRQTLPWLIYLSVGKKILLSVISILLIIILIVAIDRVRISQLSIRILPVQDKIIETNFFNFKVNQKSIGNFNSSVLVAAQQKSHSSGLVFTADRSSKELKVFKYTNYDIKLIHNFNFNNLVNLNENFSNFIFDIEIDHNQLLISYVSTPQFHNSCDAFEIIKIPIQIDNLDIKNISKIWRSNVCIHSFPNNVSWHDFHGRIAVNDKFIYLTAGLVIAATYEGYYPSPNFYGLNSDLRKEIEKDQLFGGVTQINKSTGKSIRFAEGFRGPSGITIREVGGGEEIFVADHGPRGGDELNLIRKGGNYGWPWVSYGRDYYESLISKPNGLIGTRFATHTGFDEPLYYWTPSIAPSQISVLKNDLDKNSSWAKNDIILTTLKDKSIYRIKIEGKSIKSSERVFLGARIRDIAVTHNKIFLTTDDGKLMTLVVSDLPTSDFAFPPLVSEVSPIYYRFPVLHRFFVLIDILWTKANFVARKFF